jgi:hypothetical protein
MDGLHDQQTTDAIGVQQWRYHEKDEGRRKKKKEMENKNEITYHRSSQRKKIV